MFKKYLATALIGSALLAPMAFAQTATTNSTNAQINTTSSAHHGEWRASKLVGLNVYNNNNEKVGAIDDLLTDQNGAVKAVVIGVGGFLGMGERLVAIPFDKVKFVDQPVSSSTASNMSTNRPATETTTTGAATTGAAGSTTGTGTATSTTSASSSTLNNWYPDHAVYNATKDELKSMPEFKYST
jgi:sporulation protein YlmC with PRC-barrel domain